MRCDNGQFADKRVRQALALTIDRPALIQQLFKGKGIPANDHVIWNFYPYFSDTVPQRAQDIAKAKQLLADAGKSDLKADPPVRQAAARSPTSPSCSRARRPRRGSPSRRPVGTTTRSTMLQWCPPKPADPPCSGAAEFGIVDYGHRATPDVFLNSAFKTKGVWNASQYSSAEFDAAFTEFQSAVGVDAQKAACAKIETILNEDVPVGHPVLVQLPLRQLQEVHGRLHVRARTDVPLGSLGAFSADHVGNARRPGRSRFAAAEPGTVR